MEFYDCPELVCYSAKTNKNILASINVKRNKTKCLTHIKECIESSLGCLQESESLQLEILQFTVEDVILKSII